MSIGLYSKGMHDFILDELELGFRAASFLDSEMNDLRLYLLADEVEHWNDQ